MTNSHVAAVVKGVHQSPFDGFPINDTMSFFLIWTIILRWEKPVPLTDALPS